MIEDFLLRVMGPALKAIYIIPFASYYLISKRRHEFIFDSSYKSLLTGIIFAVLHVVVSLVIEILMYTGTIIIDTPDTLSAYQMIANAFLFISSGVLLMSMYKENNKRISKSDLINIVIFILLISSITAFTNENIFFRLNIVIYFVSIYFLINTFVLTGFFLEKYQKDYYLALIGAVIMTIEPLIYLTMYNTMYTTFPDLTIFYYYRYARYLSSSIAILFLLIPHLRFTLKLRKKEIIGYDKDDTLVENTIKRLFNETQKIYGTVTAKVFKKTCQLYKSEFNKKVECKKPFKFKNLTYKEQKEYLKLLLKVFDKYFKEKLADALIKAIKDNKNDGLIAECAPIKEIREMIIDSQT